MLNNMLYRMGRNFVRLYARALLHMDVRQPRTLPPGAKIITPNHPTTLDPFLMILLLDEPVHILITESAFKAPLLGRYLRRMGHIPVVVGSGHEAFEAAKALLLSGAAVVIFPEGALSPLDGGCGKPHTGAVRLALITGAPIIPVGIEVETENIRLMHTGIADHNGQEEVARLYTYGGYAVTVGEPLFVRGDVEDREQVYALSQQMMVRILRLSHQSARRLNAAAASRATRDTAEIPGV